MWEAVSALPDERQIAVTLYYYDGLTVEEIAKILRLPGDQCGFIEGEVDISEELRENGGYHCYESEDGYKISVTVYASEAGNGTEFEGEYYRVKAEGSYPSGYTGTSNFTFDVPHKGSGNGYMEKVPLNSLK